MPYHEGSQIDTDQAQPLVCKLSLAKNEDYKDAIVNAAKNAGFQFMFDIPAEILGFEDCSASTIRLDDTSRSDKYAFIMCNRETGMIHVISQEEAPDAAVSFVKSYATVLSLLQAETATSH